MVLETYRQCFRNVFDLPGLRRILVAEDADLYRDALGVLAPPGLAEAFLGPAERPLESLALLWSLFVEVVLPVERWPVAAGHR